MTTILLCIQIPPIAVKLFPETAEEGFVSELNDEALQRARTYLAHMTERLQTATKYLRLSITWSVTHEKDVASTLVNLAEQGGEGKETGGMGGCDLTAISTHGRHGLERWVIGSVTDRILPEWPVSAILTKTNDRPDGSC